MRVHVLKQRTEGSDSGGRGPGTQEAERERELQLWMRWKFGYNNTSTVVVRVESCPNIWWRSWEEEEYRGETVTWKKSVEKQKLPSSKENNLLSEEEEGRFDVLL